MLENQIIALVLLFITSTAIAFVPLGLLQHVYRRKRDQLRESQQQWKQSNSNASSSTSSEDVFGENKRSRLKSWIAQFSPFRKEKTPSVDNSFQSVSKMALDSTLKVPSIILELTRSLDGGLLLATLFLILLPQLRTTFDLFLQVYIHGTKNSAQQVIQPPTPLNESGNFSLQASLINYRNAEAEARINSPYSSIISKFSPIPLVELILCLAFFALYFIEEFAQLCLRYKKYFWACNSSVVYSSADGTCEFTSLDYRINKTKQFLIHCSRNTSSLSTLQTSFVCTSNLSSSELVTSMENRSEQQSKVQEDSKLRNSITFTTDRHNEQNLNSIDQDIDESHFRQMDYASKFPDKHEDDEEPSSLLSSTSSIHLPSYYWHNQPSTSQMSKCCGLHAFSPHHAHHHACPHVFPPHVPNYHLTPPPQQETQSQSLPYESDRCEPKQFENNVDIDQTNIEVKHEEFKEDNDQSESGSETHHKHHHHHQIPHIHYHCRCCTFPPAVNDPRYQLYLPFQSNGYPNEEGQYNSASSQSSFSPSSAIFTKIFLPYTTLATSTPALYLGEGILIAIQPTPAMLWLILTVVMVHKMVTGLLVSFELHEKTTGKQRYMPLSTIILFIALPVVAYLGVLLMNYFLNETSTATSSADTYTISVVMAAVRVVLFAISSATLLHLVLLIIQRNLLQFQPQFQLRKPKTQQKSHAKQHRESTGSEQSYHKPCTRALSYMNSYCKCPEENKCPQEPTRETNSKECDQEIVTNPPRYGVLHHFTMYTGFIIVLMAIAFLNMRNFKIK